MGNHCFLGKEKEPPAQTAVVLKSSSLSHPRALVEWFTRNVGLNDEQIIRVLDFLCDDSLGLTEVEELLEMNEELKETVVAMLPLFKRKKFLDALGLLEGSSGSGSGPGTSRPEPGVFKPISPPKGGWPAQCNTTTRVFDTVVLTRAIKTQNLHHNTTLEPGTRLVLIETDEMYGDCGKNPCFRVAANLSEKFQEREHEFMKAWNREWKLPTFDGSESPLKWFKVGWVSKVDLDKKSLKLYSRGTRVYVASQPAPAGVKLFELGTIKRDVGLLGEVMVQFDNEFAGNVTLSSDDADVLTVVGPPLKYKAMGGGDVSIPPVLNPWEVLGVEPSASLILGGVHLSAEARSAQVAQFQDKNSNEPNRQRRAIQALCFDIVGRVAPFGGHSKEIYYTSHPGNFVSFNARHPMVLAAAGAKTPAKKEALEPPRDFEAASAEDGALTLPPPPPMALMLQPSKSLGTMLNEDSLGRTQKYIHHQDQYGESMLFKTARAGFYDLCKSLLDAHGVDTNQTQKSSGATALHAAMSYGHLPVVQLLISRGANLSIKDKQGHAPADRMHACLVGRVEGLLKAVASKEANSKMPDLFKEVIASGLCHDKMTTLKDKGGKVVAHKVFKMEKGKKVRAPRGTERAWHGTKAKHIKSILQTGLHASGTTLPDGTKIEPPSNHYSLQMSHQGINNWAGAIFVSPSVSYASHAAYADRVSFNGAMWAVVVDTAVREGSFTKHNQTVGGYATLPGEPENAEYRVQVEDECDEQIWRATGKQNVTVLAVTLIEVDFLEDCGLSCQALRDFISITP
jgi:ankyrin repeat protein